MPVIVYLEFFSFVWKRCLLFFISLSYVSVSMRVSLLLLSLSHALSGALPFFFYPQPNMSFLQLIPVCPKSLAFLLLFNIDQSFIWLIHVSCSTECWDGYSQALTVHSSPAYVLQGWLAGSVFELGRPMILKCADIYFDWNEHDFVWNHLQPPS